MSLQGPKYPFTRLTLKAVPSLPGVYALWDGRSMVFLGAATGDRGLREELETRLAGIKAPTLIVPSDFQFEVTGQALNRLAQLLKEHASERGDVPLGNRSQIRVRPQAAPKEVAGTKDDGSC